MEMNRELRRASLFQVSVYRRCFALVRLIILVVVVADHILVISLSQAR